MTAPARSIGILLLVAGKASQMHPGFKALIEEKGELCGEGRISTTVSLR